MEISIEDANKYESQVDRVAYKNKKIHKELEYVHEALAEPRLESLERELLQTMLLKIKAKHNLLTCEIFYLSHMVMFLYEVGIKPAFGDIEEN